MLLLGTEILAVLLEGLLTLLLRLRNSAPIGVFDTGVHSLRPVRPIVGLRDGYLAYRQYYRNLFGKLSNARRRSPCSCCREDSSEYWERACLPGLILKTFVCEGVWSGVYLLLQSEQAA